MTGDAYIAYTRRFFARWLTVYDLFALPVAFAYRAAARLLVPASGCRVLDLCTGTGEIAVRCARRGGDVVAVDVTPGMLLRARAKSAHLPIRFELGDARRLPLGEKSFDSVALSFALHDMPRRVCLEVLREAARVARRRIVVLDYAFPSSKPLRRLYTALLASYETAYLPRFAGEGVLPLLAEAGLEPSWVRSYLPLPFVLVAIDVGGDEGDGSRGEARSGSRAGGGEE